ncbi:MAG: NADAR family protein [Candidatus Hermodarchaeota archaeon]
MTKKISRFRGQYSFLSNFFPSSIEIDGVVYSTVEHYYQAMKTQDKAERERIISATSPKQAKSYGRQCTLRSDWDSIRLEVMERALRVKFQDKELRKKLLATEDKILEEGNTWGDTFWGVNSKTEKGKNHLGKLLMKIREDLKKRRKKA